MEIHYHNHDVEMESPLPNLGCATTEQLLEELKARAIVSKSAGDCKNCCMILEQAAGRCLETLSPTFLSYKTVAE